MRQGRPRGHHPSEFVFISKSPVELLPRKAPSLSRRMMLDRLDGPSALGAGGTLPSNPPKWLRRWSEYRCAGAIPAAGHANPRPSRIPPFIFLLCELPPAINAGGVYFILFFPSSPIFTHKMCISRPKVPAFACFASKFHPVTLSENICIPLVCFSNEEELSFR